MKKALRIFGYIFLFLMLLRSCKAVKGLFHGHDWRPATCTEARTCSSCGEVDGEPLGHDWQPATCASPKTCRRCSAVEGSRIDHQWVPATCTEPETCSLCGASPIISFPRGHKWVDATCTEPRTCSVCGEQDGNPLGHYVIGYSWTDSIPATCQAAGERTGHCFRCGAAVTEATPIIDCVPGDWVVIQTATPSAHGTRAQYCTMCGRELYQEEYATLPSNDGSGEGSNRGRGNFNAYNNESQQNTSATYVLNKGTMKFHSPSCRDVPKISPTNYATSNSSRSDLVAAGYEPCGHCSP